MAAILILTAVPGRKRAASLARRLVQSRLAACVSFLPGLVSVYRWKGKIEKASEGLLLVKTTRRNFSKTEKLIRSHHPYEVPEIIGLEAARVSAPYLSWIQKSVK